MSRDLKKIYITIATIGLYVCFFSLIGMLVAIIGLIWTLSMFWFKVLATSFVSVFVSGYIYYSYKKESEKIK